MKLDVVLKNVGCTVTKMLDQNTFDIIYSPGLCPHSLLTIQFHKLYLFLYLRHTYKKHPYTRAFLLRSYIGAT